MVQVPSVPTTAVSGLITAVPLPAAADTADGNTAGISRHRQTISERGDKIRHLIVC
jgi:hypothetical protein